MDKEAFSQKAVDIRTMKDKSYRANSYLRISKEDGDKLESDSIGNQRDLIHHFLESRPEITLLAERIDDGYSGANFQRPAFQEMLEAVLAEEINCIIVKDLSRFGRNFIEVGRYIDQIFPEKGVRFISINDNFDSAKSPGPWDNIVLPFLNLVNDAFCRDISIKVRSQLAIKRKKGDFIGSFAAYGYFKDPENRHRLIPDDFAAERVREIFKWKLEGLSQQGIAQRLNTVGVLSPLEYKRQCGMAYRSGFQKNPQSQWSAVTVGRILRNELYIGTLVQGKTTTPNHKVKKTVAKAPEEWVRVENNHPAIIPPEAFQRVQGLLLQDTRVAPKKEAVSLFAGLIFCGDCGENMVKNRVSRRGKTYSYYMCCQNRTTKGCSSHRIPEQTVIDAATFSLRQHMANFVHMERIEKFLSDLPSQNLSLEKKQEEIRHYENLEAALEKAFREGLMDDEEYRELKAVYGEKILAAKTHKEALTQNMEANPAEILNAHPNIQQLDRRLAVTLIDKILVFEDCRLELQLAYREGSPETTEGE